MVGWLLARLGRTVLAAWGIASALFLVLHWLPAPLDAYGLSDAADLSRPGGPGTAETRQAARQAVQHRLGLDEPVFYLSRPNKQWRWNGLHNQYHRWLAQLAHGHLGRSYRAAQPVEELLAPALALTVPLMLLVALLSTGLAVALALVLAAGPARGWRVGAQGLLTTVQALPLFVLGLGLLLLLANPDVLDVLPAAGPADEPPTAVLLGLRLLLPLLALVLATLPEQTLLLEAALRHEQRSRYATVARAKGLSEWQVTVRHALPNAWLTLLTSFTGLLPTLVGGAVVVEVLFALPGTGRLLAEAAAAHDYPVVVGGVLLLAAVRLLALLLADALYLQAEPRLRPPTA